MQPAIEALRGVHLDADLLARNSRKIQTASVVAYLLLVFAPLTMANDAGLMTESTTETGLMGALLILLMTNVIPAISQAKARQEEPPSNGDNTDLQVSIGKLETKIESMGKQVARNTDRIDKSLESGNNRGD